MTKKDKAPKVVLRTYRETDQEQVDYLFCSTCVPLVYESIRRKLWAPATWLVWFAVYSGLLYCIQLILSYFQFSEWLITAAKVLATFSWAMVGFSAIFIISDRVDLTSYIEEARTNDLFDPDLYYLNYAVQGETKERKPTDQQEPSHFWVLTVDDEVCGMIGLICNEQEIKDRRSSFPVPWKQFTTAVLELLRLPVPTWMEKRRQGERQFMDKHVPRTATITRWAIRSDLQACGLSTLLLNRAMTWANEHGINRVYAHVNSYHMAAEQILEKRHGFVTMYKYNRNLFGKYTKVLGCRVQEWMTTNGEKTRASFKKLNKE
jgi:N-acetylglutamate synthase-like GNAT family acetyltransferase